jgi:hypothetical protein
MPAADAVKDLTSFFDKLDTHTHKTARVLASEKVVCVCVCVCVCARALVSHGYH